MVIMNPKMTKKHMTRVVSMYRELPEQSNMDYELYKKILHIFKGYDKLENGVVLDTLKAIVIMMCEQCIEHEERMEYIEIQESMI